jgi:sulfur carrier protein
MIVEVNGTPTEVADGATVQSVVAQLGADNARRGIAVAVNAEVVPRSEWETWRLSDGMSVEVVTAIQGG